MATPKRNRTTKKSTEPSLDSLASSPKRTSNVKRPKGADQIKETLTDLVNSQIIKNKLNRIKAMSDTKIVLGKGGEDLTLFSADIGTGYDKTVKETKLNKKEVNPFSLDTTDRKVLLKKVSESEEY